MLLQNWRNLVDSRLKYFHWWFRDMELVLFVIIDLIIFEISCGRLVMFFSGSS